MFRFKKKFTESIQFKFLSVMFVIMVITAFAASAFIAQNERKMLKQSLFDKGQSLGSYLAKLSKDPLIMKDYIQLDIVFHDERVFAELRQVRTKALTLVEEGLFEHLPLILRNEGARRESGDNHDDKHHAQEFELNTLGELFLEFEHRHLPPHLSAYSYSITRVAAFRKACGTSICPARAAFIFTITSSFCNGSIGIDEGFAPLSTLTAFSPARRPRAREFAQTARSTPFSAFSPRCVTVITLVFAAMSAMVESVSPTMLLPERYIASTLPATLDTRDDTSSLFDIGTGKILTPN